ncbi:MAG: SDR family oxidoreductase [Gammaproteobacteria bacterium]|nr:MAG: SDR family oxidoreductase [Gammaproteobacteria bacterium]
MKILVTGNMGYIGPVLIPILRKYIDDAYIIGYDSGFFAHCLTAARMFPEALVDCQYFGDVRSIPDHILKGVDAVVHLAAVSNDPMGNKFENVTSAINYESSVNLAIKALAHKVDRFVFASSCSMYGFAEGGPPRKETDALNPLSVYARSKVATEQALASMDTGGTTITSLRFSTACGMSTRLRLDLVLNDFVACAIAAKEITVLSDGKPWRPLIDVKDMARAIIWALTRDPNETSHYLAVNVGADEWNYQVCDLANAVAAAVPGTTVGINANAPPDKRSYRVDFSLYKQVAPNHQPQVKLDQTIDELRIGMEHMGFNDSNFRSSQYMRLKALERHIVEHRLNDHLYWI